MALSLVLERLRTYFRKVIPPAVRNSKGGSEAETADLLQYEPSGLEHRSEDGMELLTPGMVVCIKPAAKKGSSVSPHLNHIGRVQSLLPSGKVRVAMHGALWEKSSRREKVSDWHTSEVQRLAKPCGKSARNGQVTLKQWSYSKAFIVRLIGEQGWGLLDSIAEHAVDYIVSVPLSGFMVSGCSSKRGDFPLTEVMNSDESTWWISATGSMPRGIGREWLQFSFPGIRSVRFLGIKIPPLPQGPLSVREFHVLSRRTDLPACQLPDDSDDAWQLASPPNLQTLDTARMQEFVFDPAIETNKVRLVCTKTAEAGSVLGMFGTDGVGLFQVQLA